jgi:hypothetical protein
MQLGLGTRLLLMIGPTLPIPAPLPLSEALKRVEVTTQDQGRSGFSLTFEMGRSGPADIVDFQLLLNPLLRPFNRVVLVVTFGGLPSVLMDGVITHQQHTPSDEPGQSTLTVMGEDLSAMMDLKHVKRPWPALPDFAVAAAILATYAPYGVVPDVRPPTTMDLLLPIEAAPMQDGTDLSHLNTLASRYAYVFYVDPGPVPLMNRAYWGPPERIGLPQPALSVNLGSSSNVDSVNFSYNALAPNTVAFNVQDRRTEQQMEFETFVSTRLPPLAALPALLVNQPNVRKTYLGSDVTLNDANANAKGDESGAQSFIRALMLAQARTDDSTDSVVTATGTLDALRYGGLLKPRSLVGLRGAGLSYDGGYYVKSVTHSISGGEYKQNFTLTREGTVSLLPVVPV